MLLYCIGIGIGDKKPVLFISDFWVYNLSLIIPLWVGIDGFKCLRVDNNSCKLTAYAFLCHGVGFISSFAKLSVQMS
jgi:hypothetical protein